MFDVQVLRYRGAGRELPEEVVASIAAYYRRVTTDARPMSHAVGLVMVVAISGLLVELTQTTVPRWVALASLLLCGGPVLLAVRVVRNAVRLGARTDSLATQSAFARSICRDHLLCLAGILAFVALQLMTARS
jgi:Ca2+/Na+ antiporter